MTDSPSCADPGKKGDVFCSRQSKLQYEKVTIREEKKKDGGYMFVYRTVHYSLFLYSFLKNFSDNAITNFT